MQGEPRNLHVTSTVGASIRGLRTTLEEALLELLRDKNGVLPKNVQGLVGVGRNKLCDTVWQKPEKGAHVWEGGWLAGKGSAAEATLDWHPK